MTARHCYLHNLVFKQVLEAVRIGFYLARNARADLCCRATLTMKSRSILNVGQASRLYVFTVGSRCVAAAILAAVEGGILPPGMATLRRNPRENPPGRMPGSTAGKMPAATVNRYGTVGNCRSSRAGLTRAGTGAGYGPIASSFFCSLIRVRVSSFRLGVLQHAIVPLPLKLLGGSKLGMGCFYNSTTSLSPYERALSIGHVGLKREGNHTQWRQREFCAERLVVGLKLLRHYAPEIAHVTAAVNGRVAVQRLMPVAAMGKANAILVSG